jgi:hypothetical protein
MAQRERGKTGHCGLTLAGSRFTDMTAALLRSTKRRHQLSESNGSLTNPCRPPGRWRNGCKKPNKIRGWEWGFVNHLLNTSNSAATGSLSRYQVQFEASRKLLPCNCGVLWGPSAYCL